MSIILIVVMVSKVYTYVQTHQIVYIKYVQFFCISTCLSKAVFKNVQQILEDIDLELWSFIRHLLSIYYMPVSLLETEGWEPPRRERS